MLSIGAMQYLQRALGVLMAGLFLGERPGLHALAAGLATGGGVVVVQQRSEPRRDTTI